jgi:uncharacterized protein (DUF2141 family)
MSPLAAMLFIFLAQGPANGLRLTVKVQNAPANKGMVKVTLYARESEFLKRPAQVREAKSTGSEAVVMFENVPAGDYAAAAYQDVNGNGKLDRNFIGIPKEPNGMSNAAKGKYGPPKWRDAVFKLSSDTEKQIVLE